MKCKNILKLTNLVHKRLNFLIEREREREREREVMGFASVIVFVFADDGAYGFC